MSPRMSPLFFAPTSPLEISDVLPLALAWVGLVIDDEL